MFDPIFALSFFAAIAIPLAVATFLLSRKFLPAASARLMAFVLPIIALMGFFGTAAVQANLNPYFFDETPLTRLAISFAGSVLLAGLVGWLIWHLSRLRRPI
jgi:hypothetical protein